MLSGQRRGHKDAGPVAAGPFGFASCRRKGHYGATRGSASADTVGYRRQSRPEERAAIARRGPREDEGEFNRPNDSVCQDGAKLVRCTLHLVWMRYIAIFPKPPPIFNKR